MARPKKDGEKISLYLDRKTIEQLRKDADNKGQTLTIAIERAIQSYLANNDNNTRVQN